MTTRRILAGELLAIDSGAIHRGADGFFFMLGPGAPPSSRHGTYTDVSIVHVRGSLEHHETMGSDSYESILERVTAAISGQDACEPDADPVPPSAVIMCIDSQGGVVAGLNETVARLQELRKRTGIPLIAYVNELAASAAFALTCACDQTFCPESAILGSIGTISTMMSIAEADKKAGLDVRLITSGSRKADGHPHQAITDAAEDAERARVDGAASAFFKLAGKARKVSPDKLEGYQAALFVGSQAVKAKLADDVLSLDDLALALSSTKASGALAAKGNETDRRAMLARSGTTALDRSGTLKSTLRKSQPEADMNLKLEALIKKTEAKIELATDPRKKARLAADLASYQLTAMRAESDSDEDDDEDDDDDDEDDSKAKKAADAAEKAKKHAEASKHKARAAEFRKKAEEAEEEAKKAEAEDDEEEEESAKKAALAPGAMAALTSQAGMADEAIARISALESDLAETRRVSSIEKASTAGHIWPHERKQLLANRDASFVKQFLAMRPKPVVNAVGGEIPVPPMSGSSPITESMRADLAAEVAKLRGMGSKVTIESATVALEKSLNGKAPVV